MIYQEQVQAAAKLLAGYTLGGADLLRRAMGHKDMQEMAEQRRRFVKGCWDVNQIDEKTANAIFDKIQKFAGYGFNKSHSACYGHISYWTAYLKAHYPVEFLCGLMSNESTNEKIGVFIQEAIRMGIEVLGPCVNHSAVKFQPETMPNGHLAVRFGLASVKSMSSETVSVIVDERLKNGPFKSLEDFCYRIPPQSVRRNQLEVLVQCGAFDCLHVCRAQLFEKIEQCLSGAASVHKDNAAGQMSLFDMQETTSAPEEKVITQEWPKEKRLDDEKFLTGAYFTGNPLDSMRGVIDNPKYLPIGTLPDMTSEEIRGSHEMAGMLRSVSIKVSKNGSKFAILTVEDFTGSTEAMLWSDNYTKALEVEGLLQAGSFVKFRATLREDERTGGKSVSARGLELLDSGAKKSKGKAPSFYEIVLNTARHNGDDLELIKGILLEHPGRVPVHITFRNSLGNRASIELGERYRVTPSPQLDELLSLYS